MTTRTITLTDRRPVRIDEDEWPVIASASDSDHDNQYEFQANRKSKWGVTVRRHEDGRVIVYATYSHYSAYQGEGGHGNKRGELLAASCTDQDVIDAINRVCEDVAAAPHHEDDAGRWAGLADECIADLDPEEI